MAALTPSWIMCLKEALAFGIEGNQLMTLTIDPTKGWQASSWEVNQFPLHPRTGRRGLCSECRLHPCTIFVTCSGRLISARREWLFKEIEAEDDTAQKQHDDNAKKSHVGGSRGLALAANNGVVCGSGAGSST